MGRPAVGDPFNAAVPREAESTGPWRLEDFRQRPTAGRPSLKARQKPPNRAWRHGQPEATIVTTNNLTICRTSIADRLAASWRGKSQFMSPEELRERLRRAGLTPYRLSYMLGVEPNEGSKWTRGDRPVPKGRVAQIIELTDFVAEQGAAAVPLPSLVRTANARPRLVHPAVTRPEPVVPPHSPSRDGRPSTLYAELRPESRAGFGPLHSDFVRAHNLASQRGFER
jgi:hypothetical protein